MKRVTAVALGGLVIGAAVFGIAAPAQAHNYLVASTPAANEVLTTLPDEFSVTTNDVLLNLDKNNGFAVQIQDAAGRYYGNGCVTVEGDTVETGAKIGEPGIYTMTWQVVSTDGHPVSNSFTFTWQPTTDVTPNRGQKSVPDCHGTLKSNADGSGVATSAKSTVSSQTLGTVLWIGGGILLVGIAVVITVLVAGRKKPAKP
jgi:methionine-rich copper-binding protein CopC